MDNKNQRVVINVSNSSNSNFGQLSMIMDPSISFTNDSRINYVGDHYEINFDMALKDYMYGDGYTPAVLHFEITGKRERIIDMGCINKRVMIKLASMVGIPMPIQFNCYNYGHIINGTGCDLFPGRVYPYIIGKYYESVGLDVTNSTFICKPHHETRGTGQFKVKLNDISLIDTIHADEILPKGYKNVIKLDRYGSFNNAKKGEPAPALVGSTNSDDTVIASPADDSSPSGDDSLDTKNAWFNENMPHIVNGNRLIIQENTDSYIEGTRYEYRVVQAYGVDRICMIDRKRVDGYYDYVMLEGDYSKQLSPTHKHYELYMAELYDKFENLMVYRNTPAYAVDVYIYVDDETGAINGFGVYEFNVEWGSTRHNIDSGKYHSIQIFAEGFRNLVDNAMSCESDWDKFMKSRKKEPVIITSSDIDTKLEQIPTALDNISDDMVDKITEQAIKNTPLDGESVLTGRRKLDNKYMTSVFTTMCCGDDVSDFREVSHPS